MSEVNHTLETAPDSVFNNPQEDTRLEETTAENSAKQPEDDPSQSDDDEVGKDIVWRIEYLDNNRFFIGEIAGSEGSEKIIARMRTSKDVLEVVYSVVVGSASEDFRQNLEKVKKSAKKQGTEALFKGFAAGRLERIQLVIHSEKLLNSLRAVVQ